MWFVFIVLFLILYHVFFSPSQDNSDKSYWNRSGLTIYTDNLTGLQYVKGGMFGSITPRLDESGNQIKELGR